VIVVAEGYKAEERKAKGLKQNAAEYFRDELLAAGLQTSQRIVCEAFSRDIRGAKPNNIDREYAIHFDEIRTENSVDSDLAQLANRLGVHNSETVKT
jgi:hypothetical protein